MRPSGVHRSGPARASTGQRRDWPRTNAGENDERTRARSERQQKTTARVQTDHPIPLPPHPLVRPACTRPPFDSPRGEMKFIQRRAQPAVLTSRALSPARPPSCARTGLTVSHAPMGWVRSHTDVPCSSSRRRWCAALSVHSGRRWASGSASPKETADTPAAAPTHRQKGQRATRPREDSRTHTPHALAKCQRPRA